MADNKRIFLSYNSKDRKEVLNIFDVLKKQGLKPWIDRKDLKPGSRWRPELERQIEASDVFLLFIGNHGIGVWQQDEWDYAVELSKSGSLSHAIPVVLQSVKGDPVIKGFIAGYHSLDLRTTPYDPFGELFDDICGETKQQPGVSEVPEAENSESQPLTSYLQNLWRQCVDLNTTNFEYAVQQKAVRLSLSAVYTPLDVIEPPKHKKNREPDEGTDLKSDQRIPVMQSIIEHPFLVLTGDPGSGKSTVVDFLSVCLAGQLLNKEEANIALLGVDGFPSMMPIRIILRHFAPHGLAKNKDLWTYITENCARLLIGNGEFQDCSSDLEQALKKADGSLLLLDGIDEVPDSKGWRLRLKNCIEEFRLRFPAARILVTSRPYAYQTRDEKFNDFDERRVAPFDLSQMQDFVQKWYEELGIKQARLGSNTAVKYADRLKAALDSNPRLADLGQNPLLMSLMGWLHRVGEGGALPEKRQKLYELCVEHLIDVWQRDKPIFDEFCEPVGTQFDIRQELGISKDALRKALEILAYNAHHDQPKLVDAHDIPVENLINALLEVTKADGIVPDTDKIKKFITNRAGILIETDQERIYRFPHRTFQEYLAACHLSKDQFPYLLLELIREDDDRWREALLLLASYVEIGSSVWELVRAFCDDEGPDRPRDQHWYPVLRAAQAVIETGKHKNVDQYQKKTFDRLKKRLVSLLGTQNALSEKPQDRAEVGRALSELGDPRPGVVEFVETEDLILPVHAFVPVSGTFEMGLKEGFRLGQGTKQDPLANENEIWPDGKQGVVIEPFYMAAYPVTYAQYACFVNAGKDGYLNDRYWTEAELGYQEDREVPYLWNYPHLHIANHPVVAVTWYEAVAYCHWLTDRLEKLSGVQEWIIRLPNEAEWEWAARGPEIRRWPWGDEWERGMCNSEERGLGRTIVVGSDPSNRNWANETKVDGLADMLGQSNKNETVDAVFDLAGNVWEWCSTEWAHAYAIENFRGNHWSREYLKGDGLRVLRGGACWNEKPHVRGGARYRYNPWFRLHDGGFRCCASTSSKKTSES